MVRAVRSRFVFMTVFASLSAFLAACGGDGFGGRSGSRFEVVSEGSASGVTSTLGGPGEGFPIEQTQPLTNTSMDTTTAFDAIDPTATAVVGMPENSSPGMYGQYPPNYPPPVFSERRPTRRQPERASPPPAQELPREDAEEVFPEGRPDPQQPSEGAPPEGTATISPDETREQPTEEPPPPDDPDDEF